MNARCVISNNNEGLMSKYTPQLNIYISIENIKGLNDYVAKIAAFLDDVAIRDTQGCHCK